MKAIVIHSYGASNQLKLEDVPRPNVAADQALVKIHDAGVNPLDWKIREGQMKEALRASFPFTIGQDFSGVVVSVGPDVKHVEAGDEVFGFAGGSYAEYAAIAMDKLALKPKSVDFTVAASLPTAALAAWQVVDDVAQVGAGMHVVILGAAGGIGGFATQLVKARGARVSAVAAAADAEYLKGLGVEAVHDYHRQYFEDHVKDADVVIDLVGRDTLSRAYRVVRNGGLLVTTVGPMDQAECKRRHIRGVHFQLQRSAEQLAHIAELCDKGVLKPRVKQVLPLTDARRAQDFVQSGRAHGRIVLRIGA